MDDDELKYDPWGADSLLEHRSMNNYVSHPGELMRVPRHRCVLEPPLDIIPPMKWLRYRNLPCADPHTGMYDDDGDVKYSIFYE